MKTPKRHQIARALALAMGLLTISVSQAAVLFSDSFDGVTAPALPLGWTTSQTGAAPVWATTTSFSTSAANSAATGNVSSVSTSVLTSPVISVSGTGAELTFQNFWNLESNFDGGVLQISIAGGAFTGIVAAGGSFSTGGYNGTLSNSFGNPLAGQQAWTGNGGGFVETGVMLPASANGENIQLRWIAGFDSSVTVTNGGWRIDDVVIRVADATVPEPGMLALVGLGLAGLAASRRRRR